jgi:spore maturation protein CgeB
MGNDGGSVMKIAFFGSSLVSAYWSGAATYYRGIIRALSGYGHQVTFYEPDVFDRQRPHSRKGASTHGGPLPPAGKVAGNGCSPAS